MAGMSMFRDVEEYRNTARVLCDVKDSKFKLQTLYCQGESDAEFVENEGFFSHSNSPMMENLHELVKNVANTDVALSIRGESGVGKTTLAKYIHILSQRRERGSFVHITCSAIPETLLESELFGYEAGSFTGAGKHKAGLFEIARGGTIFLDEIGDMPLSLQAKMLNVLQEKKFYRVGGTKPVYSDVRVLTATNKDLESMVSQGQFRQDLYFRLNVIPIMIPPLRERKEDTAQLVELYLRKKNIEYQKNKRIDGEAIKILMSYEWPGNVREVMNVIERLILTTSDEIISPCHLPSEVLAGKKSNLCCDISSNRDEPIKFWEPGQSLKSAVRQFEGRIIENAVSYYGSVREAARELGVNESTILRKKNHCARSLPAARQTPYL